MLQLCTQTKKCNKLRNKGRPLSVEDELKAAATHMSGKSVLITKGWVGYFSQCCMISQ